MISGLHVQNFQSHRVSTLELYPGVNAIIGESDSGKTALIRALSWALTNRPLGDEFRSDWGGDTRVRVDLADDISVTRSKQGKKNAYILAGEGVDDQEFEALRGEVPEQIARALDIGPLGVQRQLDAPFLLSETPGEVARRLNQSVNLDAIDRALSNAGRRTRELTTIIKMEQTQVDAMETQLEGFAWVASAEESLAALEVLETNANRLRSDRQALIGLVDTASKLKARLDRLIWVDQVVKKADKLTDLVTAKDRLVVSAGNLCSLVARAVECLARLDRMPNMTETEVAIDYVQEYVKIKDANTLERSQLTDLVEAAKAIEVSKGEYDTHIRDLEYNFDQLMPNVCPLCGRGEQR